VAAFVVDALEVIDVADDQADGVACDLGLLHDFVGAIHEPFAIQQTRELVYHALPAMLDIRR